MSKGRFNYVFLLLMALAAVTAFGLPPRIGDKVSPQVQILFAPVSRPVRAMAGWARGRSGPNLPPDERPAYAIRVENERLKSENIELRLHLETLARTEQERAKLGPLRQFCTPVAVAGVDAGTR